VSDPQALLRPGILDGTTVVVAPSPAAKNILAGACLRAGALSVQNVQASVADVLVVDAATLFGTGGPDALRSTLDNAWAAIHDHFDAERATKIVLVAPRPSAAPHAEAARAGLENMARTLSIEWARFGIRVTAIAPGDATADAEVAQVIAYLASPAGDYFSGCRLELSGAAAG